MTETISSSGPRNVGGTTLPSPGTYDIDVAHTQVGFAARHMAVSKVRGRFTAFEGVLEVADNVVDSELSVTVDTASVDTSDANRDTHLRSDDFLDVEHFPTMTFASTGITETGPGAWKVDGDLTIRGVTKPVTLDVETEGAIIDPYGNERAGFSATAVINRDDFGVSFNAALDTGGLVVSKKITLEIESEIVKRA